LLALLIIFSALVGIILIPVGVDIAYEERAAWVLAKICGFKIKLYPKDPSDKPKKKNNKKGKKTKETSASEENKTKAKRKLKLKLSREELLSLLKVVLKGFGKFGRKFKVDRFLLDITVGGNDPYNTAMSYAYINSALSAVAPICAERFDVKDCCVQTDINFMAEKTDIDFGLAMSIRIGQLLNVAFTILFGALWILLKNKIRLRHEKKRADKENSEAETSNVITEDNTRTEERTDSNGQ